MGGPETRRLDDALLDEASDLIAELRRERDQARSEAADLREALRLAQTTAESLLERLNLRGLDGRERLVVMAQNPADCHHWSRSIGSFTAAEVRAALSPQSEDLKS